MAAMHRNEQLLRKAYDAEARGDFEAYLGFLTDDFVMHIPGRSRLCGEYRGKDEMREHLRDIRELSRGTFRIEVHDVLANDDHAVGLILAWAERDGRVVGLRRVHIWHIRDEMLSELWIHPGDQYAFDAHWG